MKSLVFSFFLVHSAFDMRSVYFPYVVYTQFGVI